MSNVAIITPVRSLHAIRNASLYHTYVCITPVRRCSVCVASVFSTAAYCTSLNTAALLV
jgi:hypothetical protein